MRFLRAILALVVSAALLSVPGPANAASLGGFTLRAEAAPVAIQIFEPAIPIPAEPQLELNLSYSRALFSSGPTGRAVSSLMWPGDAVGYGLPTLLQNPDANYPVRVDAASPAGPKDAKQEVAPGTGMTAHADDDDVEAATAIAKPTAPALPTGGLPIPIPTNLVAMESFSSKSTATVSSDKASATAYATAGSVSLLGGLVRIDGLRTDTHSESDGSRATTTTTVTWASLTLAGQKIAATQDGVSSPTGVTKLPAIPPDVTKRLADFGIRIDPPQSTKTTEEGGATVSGRGPTITLDTAAMRAKLDLGSLLDPLLAQLPADLRSQLTPWLALGPKLVFVLGTSTSRAAATAAFTGGAPPPAGPGPVTGGSGGGLGAGGDGSTGDAPPATSDTITPVADGRQWPVFPGVPWYLFVLGVGAAAAVAYGLRRYAAVLFGGSACDLGAANDVPNLRER